MWIRQLPEVNHLVNQKGWDANAESVAVTKAGEEVDLKLHWADVKAKLDSGNGPLELGGDASDVDEKSVLNDFSLDDLDPTQRAFAERVLKWAEKLVKVYKQVAKHGKKRPLPKLRSWLCGSAGSGKSRALRTIVQHVRLLFKKKAVDATIELTAYTGVAAFNIGFGAKTASTSFQLFPNAAWKQELDGKKLRRLEQQWENVQLLIVDEISFIGRAFLGRMHLRLQQAKRGFFAQVEQPNFNPCSCQFGDLSIIFVGDFGQLEPIDDWSMVDDGASWATCPKKMQHLWAHQKLGKMLHSEQIIKEAVMLKNIHRSQDDMWWTESCLRLRDFMCTKEDWDWWRKHELSHHGHFNDEQKRYFEEEALWLCARCEDVGHRNGTKLAEMAKKDQKLVHRIHALHSKHKNVKKMSAAAFDGLRAVVNLVRGCKITVTRNVAYRWGLANGTRGTLVGVVYGSGGVGTFPEAIVVDVPEYCGPAFYGPDDPSSLTRRWVPLLPMTSMKEGTRMTREQFPIVAGFALTVNKSQGLTVKEGVVINLAGGPKYKPASRHGLPYVAWTRSESFAMTAFVNLPSWTDFEKGRQSEMLQMRQRHTERLKQLHRKTMAEHSNMKTEEEEDLANAQWLADRERMAKKRKKSPCRMPCPKCEEEAKTCSAW
jgi:hypothetical protein